MSFLQRSRNVGEVANTKGNSVEIERVILDLRREDLCVGLQERESGLVGCGKGKGTLATDSQHVGVDVGNDNGDIGIAIELVGVLKVTEGNITSSTSDIQNALRLSRGVRSTRVQRGDKVVLP